MDLKLSRQRCISKKPLIYCVSICFFSFCALVSTTGTRTLCLDIKSPLVRKGNCFSQEFENNIDKREDQAIPISKSNNDLSFSSKRRYLSSLGSSPPRCTSKCGNCTPCKPVHVPVPPGTPVTTEYYPEAWRCKCGNKLYMP